MAYVILDRNEKRRGEAYRALVSTGSAIPVGAVSELGVAWPQSAWFLVYDDPELMIELQDAFADRRCYFPILVYNEQIVPERIVAAMYAGAIDYLKWPLNRLMIEASQARHGAIARQRCDNATAKLAAQARIESLSVREKQVVREVRLGRTNREIALALSISPRTVEIHRANALAKLGARNSIDATRMFLEAGDWDDEARSA